MAKVTQLCDCRQKETIEKMKIDLAVAQSDIKSVKDDINDMKDDLKEMKHEIGKINWWLIGVLSSSILTLIGIVVSLLIKK